MYSYIKYKPIKKKRTIDKMYYKMGVRLCILVGIILTLT